MFGIGMPEMIVVLTIIVIIFGVGKLPEMGESIGKGIRNFKQAISADSEEEAKREYIKDK